MAYNKHNYVQAFVAYCNGTPLTEISMTLGIPLEALNTKAREDRWYDQQQRLPIAHRLVEEDAEAVHDAVQRSPEGFALSNKRGEAKMELMLRNREENFLTAVALRDDLKRLLVKLANDDLTVEKHFHNKGEIVTATVPLSTGDRVNLATYARTIADLTYQALGDKGATGGREDVQGGATAAAAGGITIILPGAVSVPRAERTVGSSAGQVIDLRETGVEVAPTTQPESAQPVDSE